MKILIILSLFSVAINGQSNNLWDDLRITHGLFDKAPRNLNGDMQGFTKKDDQCSSGNKLFRGQRYWFKNDPATILLFDKNGYIAGIQTSVPKTLGWNPYKTQLGTYIVDEGDSYTLTVYFVDPKIICTRGRTANEFTSQGTGTGLYIQSGTNPTKDYFQVPKLESDVKRTKWGFGKCFNVMGQHYWYNVTKDMACQNFAPYCLLYNKGVLNAFCFQINHNVLQTKRYEHPTFKVTPMFLDPVPDCFYTDPTYNNVVTTQHIYLTSDYMSNKC